MTLLYIYKNPVATFMYQVETYFPTLLYQLEPQHDVHLIYKTKMLTLRVNGTAE